MALSSECFSARCATFERDGNGRIKGDSTGKARSSGEHPYPATGKATGACYVVDHFIPLKRGGADSPENMQWQTSAEAKAKDRVE